MKCKLDENLPIEACELLKEAGHDASTVLGQGMGGEPDSMVSAVCQAEGRAILTLDTDFADIRTYQPSEFSGLIVFRLRRQDKAHVLSVIVRILPLLRSEPLQGHLWIVDEDQVRVRN